MAEPSALQRAPVLPALTGVRAIAALWVVLHHLRLGPLRLLELPAWLDRVFHAGYLGVDLFGFLSGFVIAHNYAERIARDRRAELRQYLWARLVRIGPLHWALLAVLVGMVAFVPGFPAQQAERALYHARELPLQILLLHGWSLGNPFAWNLPSWTVSAEWLCYLLFPWIAPRLAAQRDGSFAITAAALAVAATGLALRALGHPDWNAAMHGGVVRIAGEFFAGCLLQRAFAARWASKAPWHALAIGAVALVATGVQSARPTLAVVGFAVLVLALAHGRGVLAAGLAARPLVFLGEASYAIYLSHWVVLGALALVLPPVLLAPRAAADGVTSLVCHLAAIVAVSVALHLGFDLPVRRRLRRWVPSRTGSVGRADA